MKRIELSWDPSDPSEVSAARAAFRRGLAQGMTACREVSSTGRRQMVLVRRFVPEWGTVLLLPQLIGG